MLFRTGGKNWMIHRMDPPEDPDREPMPGAHRADARRTRRRCPRDDGWAYEIKWDGVRAIGYVDGGRLRLESRNGNDITPRYPELRGARAARSARTRRSSTARSSPSTSDGRPSFQRLQRRMHLTSEDAVRRAGAQPSPVVYMIFDLLWLDGHSLLAEPYEERRARLLELELTGPTWQTPAHHVGDGAALLRGLAARRGSRGSSPSGCDCPYVPGQALDRAWVKVKNVRTRRRRGRRLDAAARAAAPGASARSSSGFYDEDGELRYAGTVGHRLHRGRAQAPAGLLEPLARDDAARSPAASRRSATHFVEPRLVASVDYTDVTDATARCAIPVYKGLRDDIAPEEDLLGPPDEV